MTPKFAGGDQVTGQGHGRVGAEGQVIGAGYWRRGTGYLSLQKAVWKGQAIY